MQPHIGPVDFLFHRKGLAPLIFFFIEKDQIYYTKAQPNTTLAYRSRPFDTWKVFVHVPLKKPNLTVLRRQQEYTLELCRLRPDGRTQENQNLEDKLEEVPPSA